MSVHTHINPALLRELADALEHLRDRAVCSGCGSDVDESGACHYTGCDYGEMIPASCLPGALRQSCDDRVADRDEAASEIKALRYGLRIIAEHSSDDASRQLARAVLDD